MKLEHFNKGVSEGSAALPPVDESGVVLPSAGPEPDITRLDRNKPKKEWEGRVVSKEESLPSDAPVTKSASVTRSAANPTSSALQLLSKASGKTPIGIVGLPKALEIVKHFHTHLNVLRNDIIKTSRGNLPAGLKEARGHLEAAGFHLTNANRDAVSDTGFALKSLEDAGRSLTEAHRHLSRISPNKAGQIVFNHPLTTSSGTSTLPIYAHDLKVLTKDPTPPKLRGKSPSRINIGGEVVKTQDVKTALAKETIAKELGQAASGIREDLRKEVLKKTRGTKKPKKQIREAQRAGVTPEITTTDPRAASPNVEPLGIAAIDVGRTGDWSGAEKVRPMPGTSSKNVKTVIPAESPAQKVVAKGRVKLSAKEGDVTREKMRQISKSERHSYRPKGEENK